MRKLLVVLDDEQDKWLASQVNQSETIRKAIDIYRGDADTSTLDGIRAAFIQIKQQQEELMNMLFEMNEKLDVIHRRATGEYQ